jgi:hypothetical protein
MSKTRDFSTATRVRNNATGTIRVRIPGTDNWMAPEFPGELVTTSQLEALVEMVPEERATTMDDDGPLQVGQTLRWFCGGAFGRDSYSDKVIEGIGPDWVVAREDNGEVVFSAGDPDRLREYRSSGQ